MKYFKRHNKKVNRIEIQLKLFTFLRATCSGTNLYDSTTKIIQFYLFWMSVTRNGFPATDFFPHLTDGIP